MNNEQHLKNLELDLTASMEEVKEAYRKLAKIYHPDFYKLGAEKFREITDSYHWLLKNHRQGGTKFKHFHYYEFLKYGQTSVTVGVYDVKDGKLEYGIMVYFMRDLSEFRMTLEKGEPIPKTVVLTNVGPPLTVKFVRKEPI